MSGCVTVNVTQKEKIIEAGNQNIDPVKLIMVENEEKYEIKVVNNQIDTSKLGDYTVEYSITNKNTKKTYTKTFTYTVKDSVPPVITTSGKATIFLNDKFDPLQHIKISDNFDKALNLSNVIVENGVNTAEKGTYFVKYVLTDASGNKGTASIQVEVSDKPLAFGELINSDSVAEMTVDSATFRDKVKPTNPSGYYSYYQIKESDKTYLDVKGTFKNLGTTSLEAEDVFNMTLIYHDKYEYNCFTVIDAKGDLETWYFVDPLETVKYRSLFDVPCEVMDSSLLYS
jgi:hypothetical protein